jgi:hypothetical protein
MKRYYHFDTELYLTAASAEAIQYVETPWKTCWNSLLLPLFPLERDRGNRLC